MMHSIEITLLGVGIILTIVFIAVFIRAIRQLRAQDKFKLEDEKNDFIEKAIDSGDEEVEERFSGHKIYIKDKANFPVAYEKIQHTKPWKHRVIPTVNVTQHVDDSPIVTASSLQNTLEERRKSISSRMIGDLHKYGKHVLHSPFHSGGESSDDFDRLSTGSLSEEGSISMGSSVDGEDGGKERYFESNVYGVKKRLSSSRRNNGRRTHHSPHRPSFKKTGRLFFEAEYRRTEKKLTLHIIKASDLLMKVDERHSHPFVRAYLVPGKLQKQQTKIKHETKEPLFNENLIFTNLDEHKLQRHKMRLKVYNHQSRLKKHELIGEVDIALVSLDANKTETIDADLFLKKSEASHASVLLSICHEAALSKLQVNIEEAKNLPKASLTGLNPDPYAIIKLYKGENYEKKETLHLRNTRSPKFRETFQFHLVTDFEYPLSVFSLVVTIANRVLIGRDEILGHVIFSIDSPQHSAVSHWKTVQDDPHKPHVKWHSLVDPDDI